MKHQKRVYLTHPKVHGILTMPRPSSLGGGLIGLFLFTWLSLITTLADAQPNTEELDSSRQTRANETCHHLINISTRASIQGGPGDTIAGFIISGTDTKRLLLRGWGLDTGVNPKVTVLKYPSGELIASNDDWQTPTPPSLTLTSDLGLPKPTDAGVLLDLPAGAYTLTLSSVGDKGLGLVGVDAIEPAGTQTTIKLVNISTRAPILGGANNVIAGFIISGTGTQQALIRGWGLDAGVDTKLTVQKYPSGEVIATNDNWQTPIAPAIAIPSVYQMPKATDAAVLLSLPAGAYTAVLESVGVTGLGLIGVDAIGDESDCSSVTPPTTTTYPLTVTVQGSGKVTSAPAGIDCGTVCTGNYAAATMVTLTATANANATFTGWSGACVGTSASTSVTLDAAKGCTATFAEKVSTSSLTVTVQGNGKVTSAPAGIDCGTDCTENYAAATMVTLTATANVNATFTGWSGACTGTGASTSVTLDTNKSCTAMFEEVTTYPLNVTLQGSGKVTSIPTGIDCGIDCTENYTSGTKITLIATANTSAVFKEWSGACIGTATLADITVDAAKSCTATFEVGTTPPPKTCCKHCSSSSKPCGDSCISKTKSCSIVSGCACY